MLKSLGIQISAYTLSIGPVAINKEKFDLSEAENNPLYMPDAEAAKKASDYLETCMQEQNSAGGMVECMITGVPAGIGEPAFEKLNANLGKAILSIGAVKAFEIGDGIAVAQSDGLHNNDAYCADEAGHITKKTNHSGGIEQHLNRLHLFLPLRKVLQEPAKIWISQSKDVMTRLSFQERLL